MPGTIDGPARVRLQDFLSSQLDDFQTRPEEAQRVLAGRDGGEPDAPRLAAWAALSRVLLNLDEFITRE